MIYAVNVPVASYRTATLCAYHFVSFCAQYPIVYVLGANFAASTVLETNSGSVSSATPSRLYSSSAVFNPSHVGKYVAVRDTANPENTAIVVITAYVSATQVQCNAPVANFTTTSASVSFRIFDATVLPSAGDYFVFGNLATGFPTWQAACRADSVSTTMTYEVGPAGGFNIATATWTGAVTSKAYGWTTVAQLFMVASPAEGWLISWTEDVGGVGSNRNMAFVGSIGSTHASPAQGFPADAAYAGIMGSTAAPTAHNINRDFTVANYVASGELGNSDGSGTVVTELMKMFTFTGTDILTLPAATNPRTGAVDDYDAVLGEAVAPRALRGYLPGVRMLNDAVINRTLVSSGNVYALGNGFGVVWNGKPVV